MVVDLTRIVNDNVLSLSNYVHPTFDLSSVRDDMNYYIHSGDHYLTYLVLVELVERLSNGVQIHSLTSINSDNLQFFHKNNVVVIDVKSIQRKYRQDIEFFISRLVKRKSLCGRKHVVCVRNFDEMSTRFQANFKSLIENNAEYACFVFTSSKQQQETMNTIVPLCMYLRTPRLNAQQSRSFCEEILKFVDSRYSDMVESSIKVNHDEPMYIQILEMNVFVSNARPYINVFRNEISDLIDFLKRKRNADKVITRIRESLNKVTYYTISDEDICKYILTKISALRNFDKRRCVEKLAEAQLKLCTASKKNFVYELLFVQIYLIMHSK